MGRFDDINAQAAAGRARPDERRAHVKPDGRAFCGWDDGTVLTRLFVPPDGGLIAELDGWVEADGIHELHRRRRSRAAREKKDIPRMQAAMDELRVNIFHSHGFKTFGKRDLQLPARFRCPRCRQVSVIKEFPVQSPAQSTKLAPT
ncbi:MAG TPA: hypothetical protein VNF26_08230 [Candidatus Baltobacterales bacterium]|nr:hypothetical protein [Candidatus Baltobacterales bacterium]